MMPVLILYPETDTLQRLYQIVNINVTYHIIIFIITDQLPRRESYKFSLIISHTWDIYG